MFLAFFLFTLNVSEAKLLKSDEIEEPKNSNIEQSQDQEEFYQLDEEELRQMGYEVTPIVKNTEEEEPSLEEVNIVELQTGDLASSIPPASDKVFILGVEKTHENTYLKSENMLWHNSRNFFNTYFQDPKNQSPMPIVMNTSYVSNTIGGSARVYYGQSLLGSLNDVSIGFIRANETTYNKGARIENLGKFVNYSVGVYDSTLNNNLSGGMAVSTNEVKVPHVKGAFVFGGGYYANEMDNDNKKTGGLFAEYRLNRLKFNVQAAKSKYSNSENLETSFYFTPELQLTESLSIKTRMVKNISQATNQDEIGLSYKPKRNNPRDFELEMYAANSYNDSELTKQRIRFSAKFKL